MDWPIFTEDDDEDTDDDDNGNYIIIHYDDRGRGFVVVFWVLLTRGSPLTDI